MKKLITLAILATLFSCVEENECYKCELISKDGKFSTTEYLPCSTDIENYKDWVYDRKKVRIIKCNEL